MTALTLANDLLGNIGGIDQNNLNSILQIDSKYDEQMETFTPSNYHDIDSLMKVCKTSDQKFCTLSLNIESLKSKFNQLTTFIEMLSRNNCLLDAILIQETWLTDQQCKSEAIKSYNIPAITLLPSGENVDAKVGS